MDRLHSHSVFCVSYIHVLMYCVQTRWHRAHSATETPLHMTVEGKHTQGHHWIRLHAARLQRTCTIVETPSFLVLKCVCCTIDNQCSVLSCCSKVRARVHRSNPLSFGPSKYSNDPAFALRLDEQKRVFHERCGEWCVLKVQGLSHRR